MAGEYFEHFLNTTGRKLNSHLWTTVSTLGDSDYFGQNLCGADLSQRAPSRCRLQFGFDCKVYQAIFAVITHTLLSIFKHI